MNDCLKLPLRQGGGEARALGGWEALWTSLGEGEAERLPAGRGRGWEPVQVPSQLAAVEGRSAVWYRTTFARPDHGGRVLVRFGGAFLAVNAWLNGKFLGSHYGYFGPFGFDLTPYLGDENLLVVCCESPVEHDLARKRHVMGIFNDGDSRPYPDSCFFALPPEYEWGVPVGLWRPVELEYTGAVLVDRLVLTPRFEAGVARLRIDARLHNLDGRDMVAEAAFQAAEARLRRELRIPGGFDQALEMELSLPDAQPWQPWRLGDPALLRGTFEVSVGDAVSARCVETFGCREVAWEITPGSWSIRVNGQQLFLRGANYTPGYRLDQLTRENFRQDLRLAREANLDALRVHGHVLPGEFYEEADAAGMLVLADFPLTGAYAYHATAEEAAFFETALREQLPELVDLLGSRASVILWIAHDDPPWVAAAAALGDVHTVRQNYTADQEASALLRRLDPSRPALAASGEQDAHAYAGWSETSWSALQDLESVMLTEYGAQAPPDTDSPAWRSLGTRWPVGDEDPAWLHAGFQPAPWGERGAGLPSKHPSLDAFVEAGQRYQAEVVRYGAEQMRRRKFEPCSGVFAYQLVDALPGIGFGLLDSERRPKAAYEALVEAMAPVRVLLDPTGFVPLDPFGFGYHPGMPLSLRLSVVNDDPRVQGPAELRWSVQRVSAPEMDRAARLRDALRRKAYSGSVQLTLPGIGEPALLAAVLSLAADAEGTYRVQARLVAGRDVLDEAETEVLVAAELPPPRPRPRLPAYIAERLLEAGSLRHAEDGISFVLLNRLRPAVLASVGDLRVGGRTLRDARVFVDSGSGRVPLPRRLELPVGRPLRLHVEGREMPREGGLSMSLSLPGIGAGTVEIGPEAGLSLTPEVRLPY